MRRRQIDFPEAKGLRELKIIKEDSQSYALFKWYKERVTQVCRYRGQLVGCVFGLRPIRDREIAADMAIYGVFFEARKITRWRRSLAEHGHVAYIPSLDGGFKTLLMGLGSPSGGNYPELLELLQNAADSAFEKRSEVLLGWLMRDILAIIASSPERKAFSSVELIARLLEVPGSPWNHIKMAGALTPTIMAQKLRDVGIRPRSIRKDTRVFKGYYVKDLMGAERRL